MTQSTRVERQRARYARPVTLGLSSSSGVRSIDLLQGAIGQPEGGFGGEWANSFPFGMAAAYAYHPSRNHAFVDGNKFSAIGR